MTPVSTAKLQSQYQEYSFIPAVPDERCSEAEAEATSTWPPLIRTYEKQRWWLVVFKPYNKPYMADPDYYNVKNVDNARKWCYYKCTDYYITKETEAEKVHANALCVSSNDLSVYHGRTCYNKYKIHVSELPTFGDRHRAFSYILKESKNRPFVKYLDYYST